jgi:hypothetical protein
MKPKVMFPDMSLHDSARVIMSGWKAFMELKRLIHVSGGRP